MSAAADAEPGALFSPYVCTGTLFPHPIPKSMAPRRRVYSRRSITCRAMNAGPVVMAADFIDLGQRDRKVTGRSGSRQCFLSKRFQAASQSDQTAASRPVRGRLGRQLQQPHALRHAREGRQGVDPEPRCNGRGHKAASQEVVCAAEAQCTRLRSCSEGGEGWARSTQGRAAYSRARTRERDEHRRKQAACSRRHCLCPLIVHRPP